VRPDTREAIKGLIILIVFFVIMTLISSCAQFRGQCAVQPVATQDKIVFVNVHCEAAE